MTTTLTPPLAPAARESGARRALNALAAPLERWLGHPVIALAARFGIAGVFLLSGRTKVEEGTLFTLSDSAVALFADEYRLPLISPMLGASLAMFAEHLFPVLLVLGLLTRVSAVALLGMTGVIQFLVYPDAWPTHLTWATALAYLAAHGAGPLSLDRGFRIR